MSEDLGHRRTRASLNFRSHAGRAIRILWFLRSRTSRWNWPIPCRLPFGGWFLAYGDVTGFDVAFMRFTKSPSEGGDWKFLSNYLKPGMVVLDVGANQGFYTLLAASRVGPLGRVYAFEPAFTEFPKLQRNVSLNRYDNVVMENVALGSEEGCSEFYVCLGHQGSFSSRRNPLTSDVKVATKCVKTVVRTVDTYLKEHGVHHVDFAKIDVEGGELDVLRGATSLLTADSRPVILYESADCRTQNWGYRSHEIGALLQKHGFTLCMTTRKGNLTPLRVSPDREWTNVIAIPEESASQFAAYFERV